ncbi:MAG TPA: hypothetical protein VLK36_10635 [Gaiellaceae bacterium]|nr:hypothetical protein [Gaiellaceae bacterium]
MNFLRAVLQAPRDRIDELRAFYLSTLGLEPAGADAVRVGATVLEFQESDGEPFYHFAFLVPGNRLEAAREWAASRVELLEGGDIEDVVFDFDFWNALAFYFHDPGQNVVELIAHLGFEENDRTGEFDAAELLGLSEIGLVGEQSEIGRGLDRLGIDLFDGSLEPGGLGFVGERARTFIVARVGHRWLPTRRPAEPHPVDVSVSGSRDAETTVGGHRIRVVDAR